MTLTENTTPANPAQVTDAMVNAAWNKAKDLRMTGLPSQYREVLEASLTASHAEQASNEAGNLGKGLPNDPNNVPEKENIAPVSGADVRVICEWLATHIGGISLMDWNPCANVLLQAADRLDAISASASVEHIAKEIAFAGRMEHDLSAGPDDFWEHTVEDSRARYRAMATAAIGAGGQAVASESLTGQPYNPDDERFAKLLDSQWRAGRTAGWNECFAQYVSHEEL